MQDRQDSNLLKINPAFLAWVSRPKKTSHRLRTRIRRHSRIEITVKPEKETAILVSIK